MQDGKGRTGATPWRALKGGRRLLGLFRFRVRGTYRCRQNIPGRNLSGIFRAAPGPPKPKGPEIGRRCQNEVSSSVDGEHLRSSAAQPAVIRMPCTAQLTAAGLRPILFNVHSVRSGQLLPCNSKTFAPALGSPLRRGVFLSGRAVLPAFIRAQSLTATVLFPILSMFTPMREWAVANH